MTSLDTIPREVREIILKFCRRSDLVNLAVCSKFWRAEVVPILWKDVSIKWEDLGERDVEIKTMNLKHTWELTFEGSALNYDISALNYIYNFVCLVHNCNPDLLTTLQIENYMIPDGLKLLSDMLYNVTSLILVSIKDPTALDFVPCFKKLDIITIEDCNISDDQVMKICELEDLTDLDLRYCTNLTGLSLDYLSRLTQLKELVFDRGQSIPTSKFNSTLPKLNLVYLDISNAPVDDVFFQLAGKNFDGIKTLIISSTFITDLSLVKILKLHYLEELDISDCSSISDEGLTPCHQQSNLVDFCMRSTKVSDKGLQYISKMISLKSLDLLGCEAVTDACLSIITQLHNLQSLCIGCNQNFTDDGFKKIGRLQFLQRLNISGLSVTDTCFEVISKLHFLEELNVSYCRNLTDSGLRCLSNLRRLKKVIGKSCGVTRCAVQAAGFEADGWF